MPALLCGTLQVGKQMWSRLRAYVNYRAATYNLNYSFPDVHEPEGLECAICRDEMAVRGAADVQPAVSMACARQRGCIGVGCFVPLPLLLWLACLQSPDGQRTAPH